MQSNIRLVVPEPTPERSVTVELLLLLALILGGALLVGISSYIVGLFYPTYASNTWMLRITQLYSTFCLIGLPVLVWRRIHKEPYSLYFASHLLRVRDFFAALCFAFLIQPIVWLLVYLNGLFPLPEWALDFERNAESLIQQMLCAEQWFVLLANIIVVAIAPAVCEEMLFRGLLQSLFIKRGMNGHLAVWIVAIIFGIVHFQFAGIVARVFLGAVLGYLFYYSKTLWLPILVHAFNNAGAVLLYFIVYNQTGETSISEPDFNVYILALALLCSFSLVYMMRKLYGAYRG